VDIWISDLVEHTTARLTREGYNNRPEWTPDGSRVMFTSSRAPGDALWWQPADGSSNATMMLHDANPIREGVFTPDGQSVIYRVDTRDNNRDIFRIPIAGERKPAPILVGINDDKEPRVSPDSKWLAYISNETGREEVYVRALSGEGGRIAVSNGGGGEPLWSRDGRRVFYRASDKVIAATIVTSPSLAVTVREKLFEGPFATDLYHPNYDVSADGKSFVMVRPVEENRALVVVVNWIQELRQRTRVGK
jgi:eukaryotic-like serine/threonine-protein kinase